MCVVVGGGTAGTRSPQSHRPNLATKYAWTLTPRWLCLLPWWWHVCLSLTPSPVKVLTCPAPFKKGTLGLTIPHSLKGHLALPAPFTLRSSVPSPSWFLEKWGTCSALLLWHAAHPDTWTCCPVLACLNWLLAPSPWCGAPCPAQWPNLPRHKDLPL